MDNQENHMNLLKSHVLKTQHKLHKQRSKHPHTVQGWSGNALEGLGWLPTLGNLACLAWLGIALFVSWSAKGAPDEAIFLLAPSLLLLNRDPLLFPGLSPSRRYGPCSAAVSAYLCLSALGSIVHSFWLEPLALVTAHKQSWLHVVLNVACLAAALPNHFAFAKVSIVCCAVLCCAVLCCAD